MSARRVAMRLAIKKEQRKRATGEWGPWIYHEFEAGKVGRNGWGAQIKEATSNGLYAVLIRRLEGGVIHLAIRTASQAEPPWRDLQRIKGELFGGDRVAIQICPAQERLIDAADMYHLWVLPEGHHLGFGLHPLDDVSR